VPGPRPKYAITLTPEQEARLQRLSTCYRAPFAPVQRAQLLLLASRHPPWQNATIAQQGGCHGNTVTQWRPRWQRTEAVDDAPRAGTRRTFTPLQPTQVVALACRAPRQYGQAWPRWSGEKLAQVAVEPHRVATLAPSTSRRWLRADKLKPWRSHAWQPSTDPQFVEKAVPVLDLYAQAPALQAQGELPVWADEQTSLQARQRVTPTKAAAPGEVGQVADRDKRRGAWQLFCALAVAKRAALYSNAYDQEVCRLQSLPAGVLSEHALCRDYSPPFDPRPRPSSCAQATRAVVGVARATL
jgi:hypothetical protein